ncbi:unnamed protein product, partial [Iphiclides podalirius]
MPNSPLKLRAKAYNRLAGRKTEDPGGDAAATAPLGGRGLAGLFDASVCVTRRLHCEAVVILRSQPKATGLRKGSIVAFASYHFNCASGKL